MLAFPTKNRADVSVPAPVLGAVAAIKKMLRDSRIDYVELPVPKEVNRYGIGVSMNVTNAEAGLTIRSWITMLYSEPLRGVWMCTGFIDVGGVSKSDFQIPQMYWQDLTDKFSHYGVNHVQGSVTRTQNHHFDGSESSYSNIELRFSWVCDVQEFKAVEQIEAVESSVLDFANLSPLEVTQFKIVE
jgi:hypothetical protein